MSDKHTLDFGKITPECIDAMVAFIPKLEALPPDQVADWGDAGDTVDG